MNNIRVLFIVAALPALLLLGFIYYRDRKEKPPVKLMILLLATGAATTVPAAIVEFIGQAFVMGDSDDLGLRLLIFCFFVIAVAEELGKYLVTICITWKSKEMQHSYDGVIYAVCSSLGFAILENVLYVYQGGLLTGIMRAFTAIPLHCTVGVVMGALYAKAREEAYAGDRGGMIGYMAWAYLVPVCIHGAYDYAIMAASYGLIAEGWIYVILIGAYIISVVLILVCSNHDHRIDGRPETADYGFYRTEYRRPGRSYYYQTQQANPMGYPQNQGYPGNTSYPQNQGYTGNNAYVTNQYYTGNTMNPQNNGYAGNTSYPQNQSYMGNAMNPQNQSYNGNNTYVPNQYYMGNIVNPKNNGYAENTLYPQNQNYPGNNVYMSSRYYTGKVMNSQNTGYTGNASYPQNAGVNPYRRSDTAADQTPNSTTPYSVNSYNGQTYSPYNEQEDNYNMR